MQRILRGTAAVLRSTKLDDQGEPTAPSGILTVTAVRSDGSVVTVGAVAVAGNEVTAQLAATETAELDHLTVTWSDDTSTWTTTVEVVGGFLFSIADARASDKTLEDQGKYPDDDILAVRTEVEQEFEAITGQAFVPRFATYTDTASRALVLPYGSLRRVRSLSVGGTAYTAAQITDLSTEVVGIIYGVRGRAVVAFEHGWDAPPADLKRAALTRLRQRLNFKLSGIPDRATSWSSAEGGTFRLATPSANRTGHPDVDACLERYSVRTPSVA